MYEALYEENKWLLDSIAKKCRGYCSKDHAVSEDDLRQAGFIGLMNAANTYDEKKSWNYYARWCILKEIYRMLGIRDGQCVSVNAQAVSLDAPVGDDDSSATLGELLIDERIPPIDEAILIQEVQESVRRAVDELKDPRQRQIMTIYLLEGGNLKDAAVAVGMTIMQARQLYNRAISILWRDFRLRSLADIESETPYGRHKGVRAFMNDRTSVTEQAALWRIEQKERLMNLSAKKLK